MGFTRSCLDDISSQQMLIHPALKKDLAAVMLSVQCCHGDNGEPSAPYTPVSESSLIQAVRHNEDLWRTPRMTARCHQDQQCPGAPRKSIRFIHLSQDSHFQPRKLDFSDDIC